MTGDMGKPLFPALARNNPDWGYVVDDLRKAREDYLRVARENGRLERSCALLNETLTRMQAHRDDLDAECKRLRDQVRRDDEREIAYVREIGRLRAALSEIEARTAVDRFDVAVIAREALAGTKRTDQP